MIDTITPVAQLTKLIMPCDKYMVGRRLRKRLEWMTDLTREDQNTY